MDKTKSWNIITSMGKKIKNNWRTLSSLHKLDLKIQGIDAIPNFYFNSEKNLQYKTLITQEMLKKNILASNMIYCALPHRENILKKYFDILEKIFSKISKIEKGQKSLSEYLENDVAMSGMRNK